MIPIIVLNLERSEQRRQNIINQFKNIELKNYYILPAFDGSYITNFSIQANIALGYGAGRKFQKGELGIIISHIFALKFAQMMNFDKVIILEDDIILCEDWNQRLNILLDKLPENWEHVYLSGHSDYVKFKIYNEPTIIPSPKMVGAFSYMVNKSAYSKIIKFSTSFLTTFDDMVMHMVNENRLNSFVYFPFLSFHNADESFAWDGKIPEHISKEKLHSSYSYFKNTI